MGGWAHTARGEGWGERRPEGVACFISCGVVLFLFVQWCRGGLRHVLGHNSPLPKPTLSQMPNKRRLSQPCQPDSFLSAPLPPSRGLAAHPECGATRGAMAPLPQPELGGAHALQQPIWAIVDQWSPPTAAPSAQWRNPPQSVCSPQTRAALVKTWDSPPPSPE